MALEAFFLVFVPLFVIVDPLASMGLFLGLTKGFDRRRRIRIAATASLFAAAVLILFAVAGKGLLSYLGIELYALQMSGGILLVMIGLAMLKEGREIPRREIMQLPTGGGYEPPQEHEEPHDPSFVPLGLPMLAGPGAISLVIVQTTETGLGIVSTAIAATMAMAGIILLGAARLQQRLGANGARVITRIMGILTVAFAMQYVFDGITGWIETGVLDGVGAGNTTA